MDDLTKEFIAESQEGLERMERCLTELEMRPTDDALLAEIFRSVHTIKGTTGFLGFGRLEKLAHAGENLLGSLRAGKLRVTAELITGLLRLLDGLRAILKLIEDTGTEGVRSSDEDTELIAALNALNAPATGVAAEKAALATAEKKAEESAAVHAAEASAKGVQAEEAAEAAVDAGGDLRAGEQTVRVSVDVLNRMMNLVGELVLTRNQMLQGRMDAGNFPQLSRRLDSVTADLRETVMQARLQPVSGLFGKFTRMARDLSQVCGCGVRMEFSGGETGLDKSLLEAIRDPLTHAVRNAIGHGIETRAERVLAGKPKDGRVRLRAYQESGSVVIEVCDDGRGIAKEKVLAHAVARGLLSQEQAGAMPESRVLELIFLPGFSTAEKLTHISGRGVGMDVVRSNVEKVGGSVEVQSTAGVGTTLRMRVPLTLAIVPALTVRSGGQSFALPQSALVELVHVPDAAASGVIERMGEAELYRLRESLLPMLRLDRELQLSGAGCAAAGEGFHIAVLEAEGRRFALAVDQLLTPEEIVVKPLSNVLRRLGVFSGATVLGSGELALILDVGSIATRAGIRGGGGMRAEPTEVAQAPASGKDKLLLVYENPRGGRSALPLDAVERIERVAAGQIEYLQGRPVLQYRGELLPLRDDSDVLPGAGEEALITVLICGESSGGNERRQGLVVGAVVDVCAGSVLPVNPVNKDESVALVKGRVTSVDKGFSRQDASWKEVA